MKRLIVAAALIAVASVLGQAAGDVVTVDGG